MNNNRIKCGSCNSEFLPRERSTQSSIKTNDDLDYSCPVCGFGQYKENSQNNIKNKIILKD